MRKVHQVAIGTASHKQHISVKIVNALGLVTGQKGVNRYKADCFNPTLVSSAAIQDQDHLVLDCVFIKFSTWSGHVAMLTAVKHVCVFFCSVLYVLVLHPHVFSSSSPPQRKL